MNASFVTAGTGERERACARTLRVGAGCREGGGRVIARGEIDGISVGREGRELDL